MLDQGPDARCSQSEGATDMDRGARLFFKVASQPWEFEQVSQLNYQTFVEEIPQHSPNPNKILVDRLLAKSICVVCLEGRHLLGMVAVCGERPFSLDAKLPNLDSYIPPGSHPCEIRLLAVREERRGGAVFGGLLGFLLRYCRRAGYDLGLISATARQMKLYRHLGFQPFGPPLGSDRAPYQGMSITWGTLRQSARLLASERS